MTIEKPAVGRSGWNTTIDEVIDTVNELVAGEAGDRGYANAQDAAHVAATDPHADRAYTDTQAALKLAKASNLSDLANAATARTNLGLGNVDNTSDANKPVSTATQTALDARLDRGDLVQHVGVPLYIYPDWYTSPPRVWDEINDNAPSVRYVIANPDTGPGASVNSDYLRQVQLAQASGVRVLGYVSTSYAAVLQAAIVADAQKWVTWYGVDGIFLDETSSNANHSHYLAVYNAIKAISNDLLVVANPGVGVTEEMNDTADVFMSFEGTPADYRLRPSVNAPAWERLAPSSKQWHLIHSVASLAEATEMLDLSHTYRAGTVFVTDRTMPNPWLGLPVIDGIWEAQLARTHGAAAADSTVVHTTGAESVAGVKTFTSAPVVPAAAFPESAVSGLTADLAAKLAKASNLSDLASVATARTNLGVLPLAGGTLTGALTLNADPSSALHAATKQYVDAHGVLNVLDNGVTAGSGTSQTTAINTLIAASSGKRLRFPAGTYRVDSTVNVTVDDVHLDLEPGAVLDASNATTGGTVLLVSGTKTATTSTVTPSGASLYAGVRTVSCGSPTGFVAGDWVMITSTEVFNQERPLQYFKGEINQIASISGGTQFTLANGLVEAYDTTTYTVTMTRLVMLSRFTMTGGRVLGKGAGGQQTAVRVALTVDPKISRVVVDSTERQGVVCETTVGGSITDCSARLVNETGLGYGFKANIGARGTRISGNVADRCRHGTDADSSANYPPCRGVTISGNTAINCTSAGISTHGGSETVSITGNTADSCGGGIVSRGAKTTIVGNSVIGGKSLAESADSYRHGIWVADATTATGSAGTDLVVADNVVSVLADYGAENVDGILLSAPLNRARVSGNVVRGFSRHGIYASAHTVQDAVISGNVVDCAAQVGTAGSTASHGIFVDHANGATGDHAEDLTIEGNIVRAPLYSGVLVNGGFDTSSRSTAIVIRGNTVKGYGKNGVQLASGYYGRTVLVAGNIFPGATALGSGATSTDPVYFATAQFLADPARINNIVDAPNSPPGDIVRSFDPAMAGGTLTFTANEARYVRVEQAGTISKIRIIVGTASGNICVGVYANSGSGLSAVPGARVATSGSVTCPASGDADVSLGGSVAVNVGDWLAIGADNATATCAASPQSSAATTAGNGRHMAQTSAFPLPSTAGTVAGRKATMPLLIGVP